MDNVTLDRYTIFLYGVTLGSFIQKPLPLTRKAVTFAFFCHGDELREDETLYISHPLAACNTLIMLGIHDDAILAAAILHDVVEDGHATMEKIREEFGEEVAALVENQTKREGETPEVYYKRIASSIGSILGKGSDRLHNITNMVGVFELPRLRLYVGETERFVLPILKQARYVYLEYSNALVMLYDSIRNIVQIAKEYIAAKEENERLRARSQ